MFEDEQEPNIYVVLIKAERIIMDILNQENHVKKYVWQGMSLANEIIPNEELQLEKKIYVS